MEGKQSKLCSDELLAQSNLIIISIMTEYSSGDEVEDELRQWMEKEMDRKKSHPERLHLELWFNEPGEVRTTTDISDPLINELGFSLLSSYFYGPGFEPTA